MLKNIKTKIPWTEIIFYGLAILIISAGGFFRFWNLDTIPPGIHHDEAYNGLDALSALKNNEYKIFYTGNNGREGLFMNLIAFSYKAFGVSEFSLRFTSALIGTLTLIGFFLLIKRFCLSKISILIGLFSLAFCFWHLNFSRVVYRAIMVPFLVSWILYFFYKGFYERKKIFQWIYFSLSGLLIGVGFHTYISFRVFPLVFLILIAFYLFLKRKSFIQKYWQGALILFFSALLTAAPIFWFFYNQKEQVIGRSSQVSIFNQTEMSPAQALGKSLVFHLGSFFTAGDPNQRHNHLSYPMLPAPWAIIFAFGFFISLKEIFFSIKNRFKDKPPTKYFDLAIVSQAIFWTMLIPGVLTVEGIPHALRIIGVIPSLFLFIALTFEYILDLFKKIKNGENFKLKTKRWIVLKTSLFFLLILVFLGGLSQVFLYFFIWADHPKTKDSFENKMYSFGKSISAISEKKYNFIITSEDTAISENHKESSYKTVQLVAYDKIDHYVFWRPLDALKTTTCEDALYVFYEADEWLINQFKKKCPELKAFKIISPDGNYDFWIMR